MSSRTARSVVVVFVALLLAALVAFLLGGQARGQETAAAPPGFDPVTAEEAREFRRIVERSYSPDDLERQKARAVVRKHFYKALPRLAPHVLGKGGLYGAAAGTWVVVGLELYYLPCWECGTEYVALDAEFSPSAGSGIVYGRNPDGLVGSVGWLTSSVAGVSADGRQVTYANEISGIRAVNWEKRTVSGGVRWKAAGNSVGVYPMSVNFSNGVDCATLPLGSPPCDYPSSKGMTKTTTPVTSYAGRTFRPFVEQELEDGADRRVYVGAGVTVRRGETFRWDHPTYDVGAVTGTSSPDPDAYRSSSQEGNDAINGVVEDQEVPEEWKKPWLSEGFRAPQEPREREALWGPVVRKWTTPDGGDCKAFESGAQLCDYPSGTAFVWIVQDWAVWMQHSDGSKDWKLRPENRPPNPPSSGGGTLDEPGFTERTPWVLSQWDRGTFETVEKSVDYHWNQHGLYEGKSVTQYTQEALDFWEKNKGAAREVSIGGDANRIGYKVDAPDGRGGTFTVDGKIVTFYYHATSL